MFTFVLFACLRSDLDYLLIQMTISDALPVQFWATDCETYNEKEVCGIYQRCFCQPFQCSDEINLQFTDDSGLDYILQIVDVNDVELFSTFFNADELTSQTVYSYTLIPTDYCDQKIRLKIIQDASPDIDVFRSDCLDIKTTHECTNLIRYTNERDYGGLVYADQSPEVEFYLRVPSVFYHERCPEEDKSLELSNSVIINTAGTIKSQRRLDVFPVPDYFHRKLQMAIRHQTVEIDNLLWIREEAYERSTPQNSRWPLKKASVWLTERNFVVRNII